MGNMKRFLYNESSTIILLGICLPLGLFFYLRIWMFGKRLEKDLKKIIQTNNNIQTRIKNKSLDI